MRTYIHRLLDVAGGYIATVKILVAAPTLQDACDVVSAALSDPINTAIVDWSNIPRTPDVFGGYIPNADGKGFTYPEPAPDIDPTTYTESAFLNPPP
jgi:hypothetical protein